MSRVGGQNLPTLQRGGGGRPPAPPSVSYAYDKTWGSVSKLNVSQYTNPRIFVKGLGELTVPGNYPQDKMRVAVQGYTDSLILREQNS